MPTLKQLQSDDGVSLDKLRTRLNEITAYLDAVHSSPIFTINFGTFSTAPCSRCKKEIRWRIPRDRDRLDAECRECDAPYELTVAEDRQRARSVSAPTSQSAQEERERRVLARAIRRLPRRYRDAFVLHRFAELSLDRIAVHLGIDQQAAEARLRRRSFGGAGPLIRRRRGL